MCCLYSLYLGRYSINILLVLLVVQCTRQQHKCTVSTLFSVQRTYLIRKSLGVLFKLLVPVYSISKTYHLCRYSIVVLLDLFEPVYSTNVLFELFVHVYCMNMLFELFVPVYSTNVLFEPFERVHSTNVLLELFLPVYSMNMLFELFIVLKIFFTFHATFLLKKNEMNRERERERERY